MLGLRQGRLNSTRRSQNHIFYFIEPLKEFETDLISIIQRYKGSYVQAVAGSSSGHVTFNVHDHQLEGSSLFNESIYQMTVSVNI